MVLKKNEQLIYEMYELAPVMFFVLESTGKMVYVNSFAAESLGYQVDDLVDEPLEKVLSSEDASRVMELLAPFLEQDMLTTQWEYRKKKKDGTILWVEGTVKKMMTEQGVLLLMVCQDITTQKEVELRNKLLEKIVIGDPLDEIVRETREALKELFEDPMFSITVTEHSGGHIHFYHDSNNELRADEQKIINHFAHVLSLAVTTQNQTKQELIEKAEALEKSNKELEAFAYVASHDLQEPLRMISSYLQLLSRRYASKLDSDAEEFITYAVDGAQRMQRLIRDLLAYSRVGTRSKEFRPIQAGKVLSEALQNLRTLIDEEQVQITYDDLPEVYGDDVQLTQLFQNLLANAIKFTEKIPIKIHVGYKEMNQQYAFYVRDNGIGIPAEYSERIFQIFQRLHSSKDYSGTGIGLSICKKIVEKHGGRIWFDSIEGEGTTFYFTLPWRGEKNEPRSAD